MADMPVPGAWVPTGAGYPPVLEHMAHSLGRCYKAGQAPWHFAEYSSITLSASRGALRREISRAVQSTLRRDRDVHLARSNWQNPRQISSPYNRRLGNSGNTTSYSYFRVQNLEDYAERLDLVPAQFSFPHEVKYVNASISGW